MTRTTTYSRDAPSGSDIQHSGAMVDGQRRRGASLIGTTATPIHSTWERQQGRRFHSPGLGEHVCTTTEIREMEPCSSLQGAAGGGGGAVDPPVGIPGVKAAAARSKRRQQNQSLPATLAEMQQEEIWMTEDDLQHDLNAVSSGFYAIVRPAEDA